MNELTLMQLTAGLVWGIFMFIITPFIWKFSKYIISKWDDMAKEIING